MTILLHVCGPVQTASIERLIAEGWTVVLYFSNSNIYPEAEHAKRYGELLKVAALHKMEVITEVYDHEKWLGFIAGLEGEREGGARCRACFAYNLAQAHDKARELGIEHFSTTRPSAASEQPTDLLGRERFDGLSHDFKSGGFERPSAWQRR